MSAPTLTLDDLPVAACFCNAAGEITSFNEAAESLLSGMGFKKPYRVHASQELSDAFAKHRRTGARVKLGTSQAQWWFSAHGNGCLITAYPLSAEQNDAGDAPSLSGHMAAALAHEIRNPLLSIKGAAKLLEDVLPDADDKALAELIHRETERVEELMRGLDPLSPSAESAMALVNIHEVIQHARQAAASMAPQVKFMTDYDPSIPDIMGDHARLVQVMVNLFKNACEACADMHGTEIHVSTRVLPQAQAKRLHGRQQPVCISVRDNGPGISENLHEHLFTPFVSGNQQGKGLGLSIASAILHQHHGAIEHVPTAKGAQFNIYLPLEKRQRKAS